MMQRSSDERIALLEQQLTFEKEVRVAQATEYERRLSELNHAHAEAQRVQATYISREVYDRDYRETRDRLDAIEDKNSEQRGQYSILALGITIGLVVLTISVNVFLKFAVR